MKDPPNKICFTSVESILGKETGTEGKKLGQKQEGGNNEGKMIKERVKR